MEWSNDDTIEFLDLYERETIIWDPSHKLHKNRNEVFDAWVRIQDEFSRKIEIVELKKKKESLMATFRNCLGKMKRGKSGAGTEELYKPTWFAFSKMEKFLSHHYTQRKTKHSENIKLEHVGDGEDNDMTETHDDSSCSAESSSAVAKRKMILESSTKKKQKTIQESIYDRMERAYDIENDECDIFGKLVAERLRVMVPSERDFIMHEIEQLMYLSKVRSRGDVT